MQISPINNNTSPNFGHSFRVSICLKEANGLKDVFVNPNSETKLYKQLNSKIVGWLNEDYFENLRKVFGIQRKARRTEPYGDIHKKMAAELREIDSDYRLFSSVRSAYRKSQLGYILTGVDVPIAENIKGLKNIGTAKADAKLLYNTTHTEYISKLVSAVKGNILDYAKNKNILLRSANNKEIMLKAVFKQTGVNKSGNPIYELDSYEFHENKTKPTLPPISREFQYYKYGREMHKIIQDTINNQLSRILDTRVQVNNIGAALNIKPSIAEAPVKQAEKQAIKTAASKRTTKKPKAEAPKVKPEEKPVQTEVKKTRKPKQKPKDPAQLEFNFDE